MKRNFGRLIDQSNLPAAMQLSLELMSEGSYQVEMSDEGLMTEDLEKCLHVVIMALEKCDLPPRGDKPDGARKYKKDRVGFICERELRALQNRFDSSRSQ